VRRAALAVGALAMLWWGAFDTAFALQCDGHVVSIGYHTWRVREICGVPVDVQDTQLIIPRRYYDKYKHTYVETFIAINRSVWTYNFGSNRLIYILTFENDKLAHIDTAGYGR
jgi:hypothetical protein